MGNNSFTTEDDQFIIENYQKMTHAQMAFQRGRPSTDSIRQRVKRLEQLGKLERSGFVTTDGVFHPYYSKEEDKIIEKLYPSLGPKGLIYLLPNRSERSIQFRASTKIKVKKAPPSYLSATKVADFLGVGRHTVVNWIQQGFLKGSKTGRSGGLFQEWKIEPSDFHNFVRVYYYLYEPHRVTDEFLLSIIELTPAGKAVPMRQAVKALGFSIKKIRKLIKEGKLNAYKNFGGYKGFRGFRWYVQLSESAFEWFLELDDNRAAEWLVETARWQKPDSIEYLNMLISCVPDRVNQICKRIKAMSVVAEGMVREFEKTPKGERLKNLSESRALTSMKS